MVVFPAPAASKKVIASNILGSVNTTRGTSTTTSVNSITDVTGSTSETTQGISDKGFHCSRYDGYQGSIGEVFCISAAEGVSGQ